MQLNDTVPVAASDLKIGDAFVIDSDQLLLGTYLKASAISPDFVDATAHRIGRDDIDGVWGMRILRATRQVFKFKDDALVKLKSS